MVKVLAKVIVTTALCNIMEMIILNSKIILTIRQNLTTMIVGAREAQDLKI